MHSNCEAHHVVQGSKPTVTLADIIGSVLYVPCARFHVRITHALLSVNYRIQQKQMKHLEKQYKKEGNIKMMREMRDMRMRAKETMPQLASSTALVSTRLPAGCTRNV